jgi:hypothetical protein
VSVVGEAPLVNADVGTPVRKLLRVELDFVGKEGVSLMRQSDESAEASGIVVLLGASGRGTHAIGRGHG